MSSMYRVIVIVDQKHLAALVKSMSARGFQIRVDPISAQDNVMPASWGGARPGAGRKRKVAK